MVFLKVVLVGLASPRGLTVQCFPQEYFSPTPPFHFRCVGPYLGWRCALVCERLRCEPWRPWGWGETTRGPRRPARRGWGIETGHE